MNKTKIRVSFSDCDPGGILFFANLFKLAHIAYEEFLTKLVPGKNYFISEEFAIPILKADADFKNPIKYGDEVTITILVKTLRGSSFELEYIIESDRGVLLAIVSTVHVFVGKKSFDKILIPENLKSKLYEFMK